MLRRILLYWFQDRKAEQRPSALAQPKRAVFEEVEARLLYSADFAPGLADQFTSSEVRLLEPEASPAESPLSIDSASSAYEQRQAIIFIDSSVNDAGELALGILEHNPQAEIIILDAEHDGIEQISRALEGRENISALHIISHGAAGMLQIGSSRLDAITLASHAPSISAWQSALTADADLMLYGCDLAADSSGRELVDQLARLTGADVAASTDLTGSAPLGGDWELEYQQGKVETATVLNANTQTSWTGILAVRADSSTTNSANYQGATTSDGATSLTIPSYTVGSGSNGLLIVEYSTRGTTSPASITYGGAALTRLDTNSDSGGIVTTEIWYLKTPAAGTANIVVTMPGAAKEFSVGVSNYFNVNQTTPFGTVFKASGTSGTAVSNVVTDSAVGGIVIDSLATHQQDSTSISVGSGQTQTWNAPVINLVSGQNGSADPWGAGSREAGAAGNVTMSWTLGASASWASLAVSLNSAPNNAPTIAITPTSYSATEQVSINLHGTGSNAITVGDADGDTLTLTISSSGSSEYTAAVGTTGVSIISGNGTSSLVLRGTSTQLNNLLAGNLSGTLTFRMSDDTPPSSVTMTMSVSDGIASASDTATINIAAVNDLPVITNLAGDSLAYSEGAGAVVIEQGGNTTVTDVDSSNFSTGTLTVSFAAGSDSAEDVLAIRNQGTSTGLIGVSGSNVTYGGVTIGSFTGGSSGSNLVITFNTSSSPAAAQALIRNITYQNTDTNNPTTGARTVRFVLTDGDGGSSGNHDTTVTVSAINDAPVIANLAGDSLAYSEGAGAVVIEQGGNTTVTDVDSSNFNTGTLTVSFAAGSDSAEDVLAIRNQGTGAGQIGISGSNITYGGTTIGSFTGGSGGSTLQITFNASSSPAAAQALIRNITYQNTDTNTPTTGARTVRFVLTDGDGGSSGNHDTTVTVSAVNDAPTISAGGTLAYTENNAATAIHSTLTVTDVDSANLSSATIQITGSYLSTEDVLAFTSQNGITGSWDSGTGTLTLSGSSSVANYQTALRSVSYQNTSENPSTATRTVSFTVNDGSISSNTATRSITVAAINDAPSATITPSSYTATEQTSLTLHGTGLSVADADAGSASVTVTVSVVSGTLNANAGSTGAGISGSGSNSLTLTGTLTQINNLLAGNNSSTLTYVINSNTPPSSDTLSLQINDNGNTGSGGALTSSDTASISITAVNDAPVNSVPGAQSTNEDTALVFSAGNSNQIQISDVDAGSSSVRVTLSVTHGTLTLAGTSGLTFSSGDGTTDASMVFTGSINNINAALATLTYNPTTNYNGGDTLSITTSDLGNSGTGGTLSDTDAVAITVNVINDLPVNTVPGNQTVNEDTNLAISGISINDVDNNLISTALSVNNGTLTVTLSGAASLSAGSNGSGALTISGTQAEINATLASLIYRGNPNFNGSDTLTVLSTDGNGATDSDTVGITVSAINDAPSVVMTSLPNLVANPSFETDTSGWTLIGNVGRLNWVSTSGSWSLQYSQGDTTNTGVASTVISTTAGQTYTVSFDARTFGSATAQSLRFQAIGNTSLADSVAQVSGSSPNCYSFTFTADSASTTLYFSDVSSETEGIDMVLDNVRAYEGTSSLYNATEQVTLPLHGTGLAVADVDAGSNNVSVSVSVTSGTLSAAAGSTGVVITGSGSNSLTLTGTVAQINNLLAGNNSGTLSYLINADNPPGFDTLRLQINDGGNTGSGGAKSASDTATIIIAAVNDAPVANNDTATTNPGIAIDINVKANDTDADNALSALTVTVLSSSAGTTATVNPDGTIRFNPGGTAGDQTVTYRLTDPGGLQSNIATLTITVAANNLPTSSDASATINEDSTYTFQITDFAFNDADGSQTLAGVRIDTLPANGSLTLSGVAVLAGQTISTANITNLQFTPANNASGTPYTSFTFSVRDSFGGYDTTPNTFTFNVTAINDAPTVTVPGAQSVDEDTALSFAGPNVIFVNDVDGNLSSVQLSVNDGLLNVNLSSGASISAGANNSSSLTLSGTQAQINAAIATLNYQGNAHFNGSDTLDVLASDASGGSSSGSVSITVTPLNDAPTVANAIPDQSATEDAAFSFQFAANAFADVDAGDTLSYTTSALPAWLSFDAATRTFSGTPANGDVGSFTVDVTASDGNGGSVTDTFTISVTNTNDAPTVANAIPDQSATEDAGFSFQFAANTFADVDLGDSLTYSAQLNGGGALPSWLSFDAATRTFSGTPANGDVGSFTVDVTASDGNGGSVTDTFTISVTGINNNEPVITSNGGGATASISVQENTTSVTTVQATDADTGDVISYSITGGADAALFSINSSTGVLSFLSAPDRESALDADGNQIYEIIVQASDGLFTDTQAISITVTDVNEFNVGPVIDADSTNNAVTENALNGSTTGITASASDADASDNTVTYSLSDSAGGRFTIDAGTGLVTVANGSLLDFETSTSHSITIQASSSDGSVSTQTFTVALLNVNEAPDVRTPGDISTQDSTVPIIGITLSDPENNVTSVTLAVGQGSLSVNLVGSTTISAGANGSSQLSLSGNQSDLNSTLASLSYQGRTGFTGSDRLELIATDAGGLTASSTLQLQLVSISTDPESPVLPVDPPKLPDPATPPAEESADSLENDSEDPIVLPEPVPPAPEAEQTLQFQWTLYQTGNTTPAGLAASTNNPELEAEENGISTSAALKMQQRLNIADGGHNASMVSETLVVAFTPSQDDGLDGLLRLSPTQAGQAAAAAFTAGVVWWAGRATGLAAALLSSVPAWRTVDPLPILSRDRKKTPFESDDEDPVSTTLESKPETRATSREGEPLLMMDISD